MPRCLGSESPSGLSAGLCVIVVFFGFSVHRILDQSNCLIRDRIRTHLMRQLQASHQSSHDFEGVFRQGLTCRTKRRLCYELLQPRISSAVVSTATHHRGSCGDTIIVFPTIKSRAVSSRQFSTRVRADIRRVKKRATDRLFRPILCLCAKSDWQRAHFSHVFQRATREERHQKGQKNVSSDVK